MRSGGSELEMLISIAICSSCLANARAEPQANSQERMRSIRNPSLVCRHECSLACGEHEAGPSVLLTENDADVLPHIPALPHLRGVFGNVERDGAITLDVHVDADSADTLIPEPACNRVK